RSDVCSSDLCAYVLADMFQAIGPVEDLREMGIAFIPGVNRGGLNGLAIANPPSDEFWKDNEGFGGPWGGLLPDINQAQIAGQLSEAFMYSEAHDIVDGRGPLQRIIDKRHKDTRLRDDGKDDEANALMAEAE